MNRELEIVRSTQSIKLSDRYFLEIKTIMKKILQLTLKNIKFETYDKAADICFITER